MESKEKLQPAEMVRRVQEAIDTLKRSADAALAQFVEDADSAYAILGEMNKDTDAIAEDMAMINSDTPPQGAEQFVAMLNEMEADDEAGRAATGSA